MAHDAQELIAELLHFLQGGNVLYNRNCCGDLTVGGVNWGRVYQGKNAVPVRELESYLFSANAFTVLQCPLDGEVFQRLKSGSFVLRDRLWAIVSVLSGWDRLAAWVVNTDRIPLRRVRLNGIVAHGYELKLPELSVDIAISDPGGCVSLLGGASECIPVSEVRSIAKDRADAYIKNNLVTLAEGLITRDKFENDLYSDLTRHFWEYGIKVFCSP